jgi:hypothetical protein
MKLIKLDVELKYFIFLTASIILEQENNSKAILNVTAAEHPLPAQPLNMRKTSFPSLALI